MAERQFGPYRLVRQIAVGGMAEIHLAKTKGIAGFEKYVALKMIHPNFAEDEQFIQMLVDEAKIAVQLNHGNIAQTFDLGRVGETFYITMEYVDGADLYKVLRRGSELDGFEMPLDTCAFVVKEIASALDHAHRKRDHSGKTLGIVHRDVSPQNVLISYAGEVKLVDFGIAKATMKARQTAVGVIKGKYYYMSPEQAWGEQLDYRSDIFSAGIVLYEMITGQMLYLEEDLQQLLDMVRKADIAPPSTLRRGVPPQLERIVMRALQKDRRDRYQSAGDLATDLERFLHAYSPVFTASKVAAMVKQVIGGPTELPVAEVEVRDGPASTHTLSSEDLFLDKEELRDENSVIFRVADLRPKKPAAAASPAAAGTGKRTRSPTGAQISGPRVTRQADLSAMDAPAPVSAPPATSGRGPGRSSGAQPAARPSGRARNADEVTREVGPAPPSRHADDSAELDAGERTRARVELGELDNIGESTIISGGPPTPGGFAVETAGDDGIDATMVSSGPPRRDDTEEDLPGDDDDGDAGDDGADDGPTVQRDFREPKPRLASKRGGPAAPPALAAKIHAPAVSEIRKPRASRKTPGQGVPAQGSALQALVGARPGEPMPAPRAGAPRPSAASAPGHDERRSPPGTSRPPPLPLGPPPAAPSSLAPAPPMHGHPAPGVASGSYPSAGASGSYPSGGASGAYPPGFAPGGASGAYPPGYAPGGASGPYPSGGASGVYPPGYAPGGAGGAYPSGFAPGGAYPSGYAPGGAGGAYPPGYAPAGHPAHPAVSPGALYQLHPPGAAPPVPMSVTGQLRLFEADELAPQYKVTGGPGWLKLAVTGVIAIALAASVTFFLIRASRDAAPTVGTVRVESVPPGAQVLFDGARLAGVTPMTVDSVPVGTRHEVRVELARHKAYVETVDLPRRSREATVNAILEPITGKLRVITQPDGVEIYINGQLRARAPKTLDGIDMASARTLELRLKGYEPVILDLRWPASGEISINQRMQLAR